MANIKITKFEVDNDKEEDTEAEEIGEEEEYDYNEGSYTPFEDEVSSATATAVGIFDPIFKGNHLLSVPGKENVNETTEESKEEKRNKNENENLLQMDRKMPSSSNNSINEKMRRKSSIYPVQIQNNNNNNEGTPLSSDAMSSSSSEAESWNERQNEDKSQEYWQVQKLIKYIKAGNPTATIIALSALRDYNLENKHVQLSIKESGGLEVLLNILETDELKCKQGSLMVLKVITKDTDISRSVYNMRGLNTLVDCLSESVKAIKILTAETISNISKIKKARRDMRRSDGITRLVDMLEIEGSSESEDDRSLFDEEIDLDIAKAAAEALWTMAKSSKNKIAIRKAGAIPLLTKLIQTRDDNVVIPAVGILQECATEPIFRVLIRKEGLLNEFVHGLKLKNLELVQYCALAIYRCAEDNESRDIVYELGAIDPLIILIKDDEFKKNKPLLAAATGAICKCAVSICKSKVYFEKGLLELLVSLLEDQPENILIHVSGAIEQIAKIDLEYSGPLLKRAEAIPSLISLLTYTNETLLVNTTKAVGELARDTECRREMEQRDGFRLVWSLLKHESSLVQASAAWAICPYVESSKESGDMVRNYVGGLEALVLLLMSDSTDVQAAVSRAISAIAVNLDNLAIISDHNVVQFLARLAPTPKGDNDVLRCCIANAIAETSKWGKNSAEFGRRKAVGPICAYLKSDDSLVINWLEEVHRAATRALNSLSTDARNCITIHQCGVVPYLINMSGSLDEELRNAAAGVMKNIRILALTAEKIRLI